jgi:hypothetical protein
MPQARSYLFRQQSTLSSYDPEQQIQINIPRLQRSYLRKDSYLQFRLNGQYQPSLRSDTTSGDKQFAPDLLLDDAGAWSLIERIEVFDYLGSTVLENIDGLPQLASLIVDMGCEFTDPQHLGEVAHGLHQSFTGSAVANDALLYSVTSSADITVPLDPVEYTKLSFKFTDDNSVVEEYFDLKYDTVADIVNTLNNKFRDNGFIAGATTAGKIQIQNSRPFQITGDSTLVTALNWGTVPVTATKDSAAPYSTISESAPIGASYYSGGLPLVINQTTTTSELKDFSVQFSIPILSFLGVLSKKMVPLHNGFTIVFTLNKAYGPMYVSPKVLPTLQLKGEQNNNIATTTVTAQMINTDTPLNSISQWNDPTVFWWQITDVNLVCQILELGPLAESMIMSSSQGQPLILHTKQFRNYRGDSSKSQSEFQLPLNLNVSSLTNINWFMRPNSVEDKLMYQSIGGRIRNYLQRWEFQYGSTTLPQSNGIQAMYMAAPPTDTASHKWSTTTVGQKSGFTECFTELMKSRYCIPHKGRLSIYNYQSTSYPGLGSSPNLTNSIYKVMNFSPEGTTVGTLPKFACGLNLELTNGKSGDLICGLNTNGMNTSIRGYFHPNYLTNTDKMDVIIDAYAEYDAFINISPGIATTVSF